MKQRLDSVKCHERSYIFSGLKKESYQDCLFDLPILFEADSWYLMSCKHNDSYNLAN